MGGGLGYKYILPILPIYFDFLQDFLCFYDNLILINTRTPDYNYIIIIERLNYIH